MERKFGYYIVLGLLIGVIFGMGLGAANGYPIWGIGLGALGGVCLGWFGAVAIQQNRKLNIFQKPARAPVFRDSQEVHSDGQFQEGEQDG